MSTNGYESPADLLGVDGVIGAVVIDSESGKILDAADTGVAWKAHPLASPKWCTPSPEGAAS